MTTVAAADEIPSKRRRVEAVAVSEGMVTLDDDCMLEMLRFLEAEDLNSFAICSRRCREVRSNPLLDQTRTGTIVCSPNSSIAQIYDAISGGRWNHDLYSGNRTRLRVVGFERVVETDGADSPDLRRRARSDDVCLTGVTSLDLSYSTHVPDGNRTIWYESCYLLFVIVPNLRELDLSYLQTTHRGAMARNFRTSCLHLTRLVWNGASVVLGYYGITVANLTELYLDGSEFFALLGLDATYTEEPTDGGPNSYMLMGCPRLERLSIKNATNNMHNGTTRPILQGMIIKFVRYTPTLRWLRSDLTEENIAMLQQECPDITFLTD